MSLVVGDVVDEVAFTVEEGKVGEFARATAALDPVHSDSEAAATAGFTALAATPTHVVVSGHHRDQRAMVAHLGLALERVMVGGVRWRYHRPLVVGDRLRGTRRLVADEQVGGRSGRPPMRRLTLETAFVDAEGATAVEWQETVLERGR
ncbi:FAS1-like dehydratase domain-containing protein [Pseudonocardia pini]|uniref:FAS1-like dehydratase domain-containing protein n=1 Tax=Pseudonocardia pini TaxID=2758030 RepID=UPI0028B10162|nr:MaoC family dehydratase N-terminal domain-containing protein [Pseudonocardia pini]